MLTAIVFLLLTAAPVLTATLEVTPAQFVMRKDHVKAVKVRAPQYTGK